MPDGQHSDYRIISGELHPPVPYTFADWNAVATRPRNSTYAWRHYMCKLYTIRSPHHNINTCGELPHMEKVGSRHMCTVGVYVLSSRLIYSDTTYPQVLSVAYMPLWYIMNAGIFSRMHGCCQKLGPLAPYSSPTRCSLKFHTTWIIVHCSTPTHGQNSQKPLSDDYSTYCTEEAVECRCPRRKRITLWKTLSLIIGRGSSTSRSPASLIWQRRSQFDCTVRSEVN